MSISILSRPQTQVEAENVSSWNASENPIVYGIQRTDQNIVGTIGTTIVIIQVTIDLTAEIAVGDSVFLSSGVYFQGGTVTDITATQITTDIPFIQNTSGGFMNFKKNYRIKVDFIDPLTNRSYFLKPYRVRTEPSGLLDLDVHEALKTLLESEDDFDYDVLNLRDENLSKSFFIQLTEFFEGSSPITPDIVDSANVIFATLSAKQIGDLFGSNMGEYVPFSSGTVSAENRAKWLTRFDEVPMWEGFPFDMQFIYSESLVGFQVFKNENYLDKNGNIIGTINIDLDQSQNKGINRLTLGTPVDGTDCIEISILNKGEQGEYEGLEYENFEYDT